MKIGILTFHRAINYGALLQCTALYVLLKSFDHTVEVIDYRPDSIEHDRKYFTIRDIKNKSLKDCFIYIASCMLQFLSKKRMKGKLDDYLRNYLKLSKTVYSEKDISKDYDVIFFGSDQIWNPEICYGLDEVYFGNFDAGNAKKIAYAASLGRMDLITGDLSQKFKKYVGSYDVISVREQALKKMLQERFCINSQVVCDPSLLPSREMYYEMTHPVIETNYIALFILERNPEADVFAKRISEQTGYMVLKLYAQKNPLTHSPFEFRKELSPLDFLSYIRYARCVITDSFHATSFSVIMQTDFYTLKRNKNNERSETILNVAGLTDRIIKATDIIDYSSVDFTGVDDRLNEYKKQSISYINSALR